MRAISVGLIVVLLTSAGTSRAADDDAGRSPSGQPPAVNAAIEQAFRAAYNLDHDEAMTHARRAVALGPNESSSHRTLAAILWLNILFHRGAVSIDYYLGSLARQRSSALKPRPELVAEFKTELAKAIELAEARLKQNPRDLQARFEFGSVYALQASYTASVEGSMTAAFGSARRAYDGLSDTTSGRGRGGAGRGGDGGGRGGRGRPIQTNRTEADYKQPVERWIVPDYRVAPRPRAEWTTARGSFVIELYPGDAPLGLEYLVTAVETGAIVGTEFGRVVPNFVAQNLVCLFESRRRILPGE